MNTDPYIPTSVPVICEGVEAKDIFKVRDERDSALATITELRERVKTLEKAFDFPEITKGNAKAISFHVSKGEPFGGLNPDALVAWLDAVADGLDRFNTALQPTAPTEPEKIPVGTRVRFLKTLTAPASGDHPDLLFANKGDAGEVTGHGCPEGYWVKRDGWDESFGASREEFEPEPEKAGSADAPMEGTRCDVCNCILTSDERRQAIDTGFQECVACGVVRHMTSAAPHPATVPLALAEGLADALERITTVQGADDCGGSTWQCGQIAKAALAAYRANHPRP